MQWYLIIALNNLMSFKSEKKKLYMIIYIHPQVNHFLTFIPSFGFEFLSHIISF